MTTQKHTIHTGDVLAVLKTLPDNYFDACLSDPPYGIDFMGKEWDKGVPSTEVYTELLRVLKPGAFSLHFGGTRTYHRLTCNIEDAGFTVRDCLMYLYGVGFPKSHNISKALDKQAGAQREVVGRNPNSRENCDKSDTLYESGTVGKTDYITAPSTPSAIQWNGYGTALKPAYEPCVLVQKPLTGTFANNALTHGCGGLNIDGCRVGADGGTAKGSKPAGEGHGIYGAGLHGACDIMQLNAGRFPANLILDPVAAAALDATQPTPVGPSRFFYSAKVSSSERNAGYENLPEGPSQLNSGGIGRECSVEKRLETNGENAPTARNAHPTLKPIALTTYFSKLLLPPVRPESSTPRRILVPFSGAGSEMIGALLAGWDEVSGIEIDPQYVAIAEARIAHHTQSST